jgi:iron complex transport system substrate-binding protein
MAERHQSREAHRPNHDHGVSVKIVSLLPSATEIVFALGLGDALVGVSFECDYPPEARRLPVVSGTALPIDTPMSAAEIDAEVSTRVAADESIYSLDAELIRTAAPDVILAQDLCAVCAVPSGAVEDALDVLGCRAQVVSLDPSSLDDVIGCIGRVGGVVDREAEAATLMADLRERIERVRAAVAARPRPRAFALEWSDPPFNGGHWVPDMIDAAGGEAVLSTPGARSRRLSWAEIAAAAADVVLFMPCGYTLDDAVREGAALVTRPELEADTQLWALAGDAYFSRPGPRVVEGVEILATILHPGSGVTAPPDGAVRLR